MQTAPRWSPHFPLKLVFLPMFFCPFHSLCVQISSILARPRQSWLQWHPDKAQRCCCFAALGYTHPSRSLCLLLDSFFWSNSVDRLTRVTLFPIRLQLHTCPFPIRWWEAGGAFHRVSSTIDTCLIMSPNTRVPPLLGSPLWLLQLTLLSFVPVPNVAVQDLIGPCVQMWVSRSIVNS